MRPPKDIETAMKEDGVGIEYFYCACLPDDWPRIKKKYALIEKHPLEPHLCIGYELRLET